jgi:hypothetical protein
MNESIWQIIFRHTKLVRKNNYGRLIGDNHQIPGKMHNKKMNHLMEEERRLIGRWWLC